MGRIRQFANYLMLLKYSVDVGVEHVGLFRTFVNQLVTCGPDGLISHLKRSFSVSIQKLKTKKLKAKNVHGMNYFKLFTGKGLVSPTGVRIQTKYKKNKL